LRHAAAVPAIRPRVRRRSGPAGRPARHPDRAGRPPRELARRRPASGSRRDTRHQSRGIPRRRWKTAPPTRPRRTFREAPAPARQEV